MRHALTPLLVLSLFLGAAPALAAGVPQDATAVIYAKGGCTAADLIVLPSEAAAHLPSDGPTEDTDDTPGQDNDAATPPAGDAPSDDGSSGTPARAMPSISLSELFPDPEGTDADAEFIELHNASVFEADLDGWILKDGKDRAFALDGRTMPAGGYLVLPYATTKIALTNTGFSMSLIADDGTVQDTVDVGAAVTGESYARNEDGWRWTPIVTAGAVNEFPMPDATASVDAAYASETTATDAGEGAAALDTAAAGPGTGQENDITDGNPPLTVTDLDDRADGDLVTVSGVVSLPSGRAASTIFAIMDPDGGKGAFVRMYGTARPDVPALADVIVKGRVRRDDGTVSLNAVSGGVTLLASRTDLLPVDRDVNDIGESTNGILVSITGDVADKGTSWLLLADPEGTREITVRLPDGMPIGPVVIGSRLTAIGVVRYRNGSAELLSLDRSQLNVVPEAAPETGSQLLDGAISAANAGSTTFDAAAEPAASGHEGAFLAIVSIAVASAYAGWRIFRCTKRKSDDVVVMH